MPRSRLLSPREYRAISIRYSPDQPRESNGEFGESGTSGPEDKGSGEGGESEFPAVTKLPTTETIYRGTREEDEGKKPEDYVGGSHFTTDASYAAQYHHTGKQEDVQAATLKPGKYLDFRNLGENFSPQEAETWFSKHGIDIDAKMQDWNHGGGTIKEGLAKYDSELDQTDLEDGFLRSSGHLIARAGYDGFVFPEQGSMSEPSYVIFNSKSLAPPRAGSSGKERIGARFNPNHDDKGEFASGDSGSGASGGDAKLAAMKVHTAELKAKAEAAHAKAAQVKKELDDFKSEHAEALGKVARIGELKKQIEDIHAATQKILEAHDARIKKVEAKE